MSVTFSTTVDLEEPLTDASREVVISVLDEGGSPVVGARVVLYRTQDDLPVAPRNTDSQGRAVWLFNAANTSTFYAASWRVDGSPVPNQGVTARGLAPTVR